MGIIQRLRECARANPQHIVLFEGEECRTLIAAETVVRERLAEITLLGDARRIRERLEYLDLSLDGVQCVNPRESPMREEYAAALYERRKNSEMTEAEAWAAAAKPAFFAGLMVAAGAADAFVGGAETTTAETTRAALWTIGKHPEAALVSSFHLMLSPQRHWGVDGALIFADCAVVPDPSANQLAEIALAAAENAHAVLEARPRIAMLSFSTLGSAEHRRLETVIKATQIVKARAPEFVVEGETQLDAALMPEIAARKAPCSGLEGQANVLIFPDLNAGNIGYKMAERMGGCTAIGPIYQGLAKAASDLSRGAESLDIVNAVVLTAFQVIARKAGLAILTGASEDSAVGNGHRHPVLRG